MKLFILNSKPFDPNGYIFRALVRALKRQKEVELVVLALEDLAQVPCRPDTQALLVYGGEELHRIPASAIQGAFGRRAVWFTEDPYERERNKLQAGMFQSVFSNDSGSVSAYPQARYLPLAADAAFLPASQSGLPAYPPERLAFFSGTAWPNRKHLLAALKQTLEQPEALDLHLVANAVVESTAGQQGLEHPLHFSPPIPISEFCQRAERSLCTLVIGRDFSGSGRHTYARSPGPRLFEAGITGSCQLVYAGEIPEVPDGLEEGSHFLGFDNLLELVSLLREARQAPERFQAIGAAMAAQILAHHTYEQRAEVLVSSLRGCQPETVQLAAPARSSLRVLFISHEQTRPGFHFGGAGLCLDRILAAAPPQSEVRVLCRSGDDGRGPCPRSPPDHALGGCGASAPFRVHTPASQRRDRACSSASGAARVRSKRGGAGGAVAREPCTQQGLSRSAPDPGAGGAVAAADPLPHPGSGGCMDSPGTGALPQR